MKRKAAVCCFYLSLNFVLDDVDFSVSGGGVRSGGVGGPYKRFLGGGGCCGCCGGGGGGSVLNAEGFVFISVGGVCAGSANKAK